MLDREDPLWNPALVPESLSNPDAEPPPLKNALAQALESRPELTESSLNIAISKLNAQYYKDQTKPRIDAVVTFAASGLAGTQNDANPFGNFPMGEVPPHLLGGNRQSLANIWDGRYPTAKVGVQISLPLRNRTAEANAANALTEKRRLEIVKNQLERFVEADVRNALEQWNSARTRYDAAIIARRAAEEQYASEQRQYQAGTSTMFLVFQRQNSFIAARSSEVRARANLAEAIANADRATARTMEKYQIKLEP